MSEEKSKRKRDERDPKKSKGGKVRRVPHRGPSTSITRPGGREVHVSGGPARIFDLHDK